MWVGVGEVGGLSMWVDVGGCGWSGWVKYMGAVCGCG